MKLVTLSKWDDALWQRMRPVYEEAFPHGAKPASILRAILDRGIGHLHMGLIAGEPEPASIAVTGVTVAEARKALVIDYLAVSRELRGRGAGRQFVRLLTDWAVRGHGVQGIVIEVEAEDTDANRARMRFWERCGFRPTDYVHHYVWVPEPYRAMVLHLAQPPALPEDGGRLFRHILAFHEKAYRRR